MMRTTIAAVASLAALACVHAAGANDQQPGNSFAVSHARVFDGRQVTPRATIVVRDGLVETVAPDAAVPSGLPVVDGRGMTVIPGLIDSHVHVTPGAQADALRFGVTTVLDMYHLGGAAAGEGFRAQRESLARATQADTWTSMAGVTPPGGHPSQLAVEGSGLVIPTLAADEEAEAFVRALVADGADYIKIIQDDSVIGGTRLEKFSGDRLREIIDAVHAHERVAVVHVSAHEEALLAFKSGADMIAHVFQDRPADRELVRAARERRGAVITTLAVLARASGADHADRMAADPQMRDFLSSAQQQTLAATFGGARPEILEDALASVRRFHAAGVAVLAGSDAPNPGTAHGASIHHELELLVEAGLTPTAALTAATALPAERFGLADRGRIAPGMRADLVLLDGDPFADITQTRRIVRIWKNGYDTERSAPAKD